MKQRKPHLSASQIDMFGRCPEQWRRRYVEKEIIPPGIALVTGTGVHVGAKVNFSQKIESHEDLPKAEIVEAAVAGVEAEVAGGVLLTEEEQSRGAANVIGALKDDVAALAGFHAEAVAPDYQPVAVEAGQRIVLPHSPRDLIGYIDLVDDQDRIVDFKTVKRSPSEEDVASSVQLTVYAAAFETFNQKPPKEVRLDALVKTKTPKRKVLSSTRGPRDYAALSRRLTVIQASIDAGIFPPAPAGAWWCSERFCGFARSCPYFVATRGSK